MRPLIAQLPRLLLIFVLGFVADPVVAANSNARPTQARSTQARTTALKRLGYFLSSENREVRAEFAFIAMDKMIAAYERELENLHAAANQSVKGARKRMRWAQAVNQYLDYLYAMDDVIKQAPDVEIIADQPGPLQLLSGEFLLPITAPRIARPEPLENAIIDAFCSDYPCDPRALDDPLEPVTPPKPRSGWSFQAGYGSTYQTVDGLKFMFSNVRKRALKEQICLRISQQLRRLVESLKMARQRGQMIDWRYLKIGSGNNAGEQYVLLSAKTAALRLIAPDLALVPGIVDVAKPWLKAQLEQKPIAQFFPGADLLLAKLMIMR